MDFGFTLFVMRNELTELKPTTEKPLLFSY